MKVESQVTAADIARIAGVGRAAVSNWRRRHPDFPAPIGGPLNSPTFAWPQVESWLRANGRISETAAPSPLHSGSAKAEISGLNRCLAALVPPLPEGTVFDPACGDGALLSAVAQRLGPRLSYSGQDVDPALVRRARDSLSEVGVNGDSVAVASGDQDRVVELHGRVQVVVSIAPASDRAIEGFNYKYGQPTRADHALGWVQVCLSCLAPDGTAVVAVPFAIAVRSSARRIRAELLRAGVLTHVIGLPERAVGGTTGPWQLWILTQPVARPTYLLRMVDLNDRNPDELPQDDDAWERVFTDPNRTRDVPSIELLDEDVLLVPAAHIAPEIKDVAPEYADLRDQYRASAHRLNETAPTFETGRRTQIATLVTLTDLARSGALAFIDRDQLTVGDVVVPSGSANFDAEVVEGPDIQAVSAGSFIRCDPQTLDPYFLACFLRSETNRRQAAGTSGGTFRLDVRRARVPRMPLAEQHPYGEAFRRLMAFNAVANDVASRARDVTQTAIYGLTSGTFIPDITGK